jgi:multiple sugar transport system ATP-binding protein
MIAGLHVPTGGSIFFGDEEVTKVPPENRGIGLVFQNYALYPHFTVRQNISFPLDNIVPRLTKVQKEEIVREVARVVDIEPYLDRKPKELSGGQQQRVAIARALSKNPRVLLLDEPLSNLDARLRLQTREEIKRIQKATGITTVFVTHDQEEAMSISDFIVVMKDGIIQQIGEPQSVYEEPTNLFVATFLGSPAINIIKGYVKDSQLFISTHDIIVEEVDEELPIDAPEGTIPNKKTISRPNDDTTGDILLKDKVEIEDSEVFIGVRPESFKYHASGIINVDVANIETIGRDISVIGNISGNPSSKLRIITSSDHLKNLSGKSVVTFNLKNYFVFSKEGSRLI